MSDALLPSAPPVVPLATETKPAWIEVSIPAPKMPGVYDPQKNSPIPKPRNLCCPTCGQRVQDDVKKVGASMSVYVTAEGKDFATIAESADTLVVQGVTVYRKDKWVAPAPAPATAPAPTK